MAFDDLHSFPVNTPEASSNLLSEHAFTLARQDHELRNISIAGGAGALTGAGLTGLGEIGLWKVAEPLVKPMAAIGFGMMGGGRMASDLLYSPSLSAVETLASFGPKPLVIGAAIGAIATIGGYELYEHLKK